MSSVNKENFINLCLVVLSIFESGELKSPTVIILVFISSFNSVNVCFMYLGALLLDAYIFIMVKSSWWIDPFIITQYPLSLVTVFDLKSILSKCDHPSLLVTIYSSVEYLFLFFHFPTMCVFVSKINLLLTALSWVLFFYPFSLLCLLIEFNPYTFRVTS